MSCCPRSTQGVHPDYTHNVELSASSFGLELDNAHRTRDYSVNRLENFVIDRYPGQNLFDDHDRNTKNHP